MNFENCISSDTCTETLSPPTRKKRPFLTIHKETRVWKIANKRKFNPATKKANAYGQTILAANWKDKPYKVTFRKLDYAIGKKGQKPTNNGTKDYSTYVLSVKNGINLYYITRNNGVRQVKNCSNKPTLVTFLNLNKKSQVRNVGRIINTILQENGIRRRIKLKDINLYNLDQLLLNIIYPGLSIFNFKISKLDVACSRFLRKDIGLKLLLRKCVGASGRKITNSFLAKVNKSGNLDILTETRCFKGLIPIDHMHLILERDSSGISFGARTGGYRIVRQFLKQFSVERRVALLKESLLTFSDFYIYDTIKAWHEVRSELTIPSAIAKQGWIVMHDWVTKESVKLRDKPRLIEYKEKWEKVDNLEIGEFIIKLPRITTDLITLGQKLNMCVGGASYQSFAVKKEGLILEIRRGGEPVYCMSVKNGRIDQFRGNCNARPGVEDHKLIIDALVKQNILGQIETYPEVIIPNPQMIDQDEPF